MRINRDISGITIVYPEKRVFAFNPYYIKITGFSNVGDMVSFSFNGLNFKRFSDLNKEILIPVGTIFQSFFKGVKLGQVNPKEYLKNTNSSSKLIVHDAPVGITINEVSTILTFDIIWGALQKAEDELMDVDVFSFGNLPLTITQNIGNGHQVTNIDNNGFPYTLPFVLYNYSETIIYETWCKEIFVNGSFKKVDILEDGNRLLKTYNIISSDDEDGAYIRWISSGEYKYFLFKINGIRQETKDGNIFTIPEYSMFPENDEYINPEQLKDKSGNEIIDCGISTANIRQQKCIYTLQRAIKTHLYQAGAWVECRVSVEPFTVSPYGDNQEIKVTITKQPLYIESL